MLRGRGTEARARIGVIARKTPQKQAKKRIKNTRKKKINTVDIRFYNE